MGNTSSQPARSSDLRPSRARNYLPFTGRLRHAGDGQDGLLHHDRHEAEGEITRHVGTGQSGNNSDTYRGQISQGSEVRERSRILERARGSFRGLLSRDRSIRRRLSQSSYSILSQALPQSLALQTSTASSNHYSPPRLPSIDVTSTFTDDAVIFAEDADRPPHSSHSTRRANFRFNSLRPNRSIRHLASSLRRRQSPQPMDRTRRSIDGGGEDQAILLSRLLSIAAAATAATLMGDDPRALSAARTLSGGAGVGDFGSSGEDGSFDGFLRALQNGRIASALREGADSDSVSREGPLNFVRMFRFGPSSTGRGEASPRERETAEEPAIEGFEGAEGRLVPIIIVGIRSISPGSGSGPSSPADDLPPFIDSLGNFPSPLPANVLGQYGHDSIDAILRPPQNGTSFRHRRRASLGGFGMSRSRLSERLDEQRSTEPRRERPWSVASSSSQLEPRPPPATPASPSPELSRIPSRSSTPVHSRPASFIASSVRDSPQASRRNSILHRATAASTLSAHTEEAMASSRSLGLSPTAVSDLDSPTLSPHRRSDTVPNVHYPRFASGHPRRNGVVEPDHLSSLSTTSTANGGDPSSVSEETRSGNDSRSWIIYVLGGSYPENHPILTTPSLFTENPTYEDMMLLSALLGPAKAPVATDEDVQSAGGVYSIVPRGTLESTGDSAKTAELVALATESQDSIDLEAGQRCLVCLCDFEADEAARKLIKCNHLFHRECIDQGRNSCPLCRAEGVEVTKTEESSPTVPATPTTETTGEHVAPRSEIEPTA